jgi:chromosome segregation ATPase
MGGGLLVRSATSPYLFSGLLVCSECGAKVTIVTGSSKKGRASYGCSRNYSRGTCSNDLHEKRDVVENHLLAELQRAVLRPEIVDQVLGRFEEQVTKEIDKASSHADDLRKRRAPLEAEIANLTRALADAYSSALTGELARREKELAELNARLISGGPGSIQATMKELRQRITTRLTDIRSLLSSDAPRARAEISRHVDKIVLRPWKGAASASTWRLVNGA